MELQQQAKELGLTLTDEMIPQFEEYARFLLEYNQKVNLTAITDPREIETKHFLDSLLLLSVMEIPENATVIDIGTGAGFPGVPLKIVRPDLRLTLLDTLNKRLIFLEQLTERLGIECKLVHARAEQAAQESPFREGYQLVVSRAVTKFPALAEYCIPFVEVGGLFVAYKGPEWEPEYKEAKGAITKLGGKLEKTHSLALPDGSSRTLLVIRKAKETPDKYPRLGIKIAKNPL